MESSQTRTSVGGYDPSFFDELAKIEDQHFWFRARNQVIFELSSRIARQMHPRLILEIGCGTGNVLRELVRACPSSTVVGMDLWFEGLCHAQRRSGALLVQGDARNFPFKERFDMVGAFDVIEHIPEDVETLSSLRKAMAPGGRLLLTVPAHQYLWSYFDEAAFHCRRYSKEELDAKLRSAGFVVEFISQYMFGIWPLVWLYRKFMGRSQREQFDSARTLSAQEFRIFPVINGILTYLLTLEARWLAAGHALPLGTSLIVVARAAE